MSSSDEPTFDRWLTEALELDQDERAYLASLDLPSTWRDRAATATDWRRGWLALFSVIAAFVAWSVAAQPLGDLLGSAYQVGLSTLLLTTALGLLFGAGQSLIELSTSPALGLSQPLLVLLALALLFWPRIWTKSAPHPMEGVPS